MIGPDGATHIETDRFCYRNLEEHSKSKSIQFSTSLILDPSNLSYGSLIPGSAAFNYNKDNEKGTTWATVAGTNAQGGDPLIIHDLLNSDDISKLNRNREAIQTREDGKHSHVRLYLPIANMQQIWKAMQSSSQSEFEHQVDLVLKKAKELKAKELSTETTATQPAGESNVESETVADEANPTPFVDAEAQVIAESVFGESWTGEAVVVEDTAGDNYLAYKGKWLNKNGAFVEGRGLVKIDITSDSVSLHPSTDAQTAVKFDPNAHAFIFNTKSSSGRFTYSKSFESVVGESLGQWVLQNTKIPEGVETEQPDVWFVRIEVNSFISAAVVEPPLGIEIFGRWKGDNRAPGELGSSRTSHSVLLKFDGQNVSIVNESKLTGETYKLDSQNNIINSGKAEGKTLYAYVSKTWSDVENKDIYSLTIQGNERNPIAVDNTPFELFEDCTPGITLNFDFKFDRNGNLLEEVYRHNRFPSYEAIMNDNLIYFREVASENNVFDLFDIPLRDVEYKKTHLYQ